MPCLTGQNSAYYFSDTECTKPMLNMPTGCAPTPYVHVMTPDLASCKGPMTRFYTVGAKVTPAKVYTSNGSACVETTMPTGDLYDAATEMPPASFTLTTRKTL